jgi:ATP-binding cassette subfamily B protein
MSDVSDLTVARQRRRALGAALRMAWDSAAGACAGLLGTTVIGGVAPVAAAWLTKDLLDQLAAGRGDALAQGAVIASGGGLIVVLVAGRLGPIVDGWLGAELERRMRLTVQGDLSSKINGFRGLAVFEDPRFHAEIQMAQEGGRVAPAQLRLLAPDLLRQALMLGGFVVAPAVVEPLFVLLIAAAAAPGLLGEAHLGRRRAELATALGPAERLRLRYNAAQVDVRAVKEIRLFGLGGYLRGRMLRELAAITRGERQMDVRGLRLHAVLGAAGAVVSAGALAYLLRMAVVGAVTVGEALLVVAALAGAQAASTSMVASMARLSPTLLFFGSYDRFLAHPPDMGGVRGTGTVAPLRHAITFENVWFRYSERGPWVLRGVNLEIPARSAVALAGHTAAGKSTIIKLLCRLYDPQHGVIRWDGIDVRWFDIDHLRAEMTAVFQDPMEYELSAADNVGLGAVGHIGDRGRITAAARRAGVDGDLVGLPAGYDSLLAPTFNGIAPLAPDAPLEPDPGGVTLSGGQWRRVAVARMLLRDDAQVALMDEPTQALDADAANEILPSLRAFAAQRTVVLATHRQNLLRLAARVYVLDNGRVVESGTHDDLLARDGTYARMFSRQAGTH